MMNEARPIQIVRRKTQSGQAGLISLLVVILILAVLGSVLYPRIAGRSPVDSKGEREGPATPLDRADDTACLAYMQQVTQAAMMYRQEHNRPAPDLESLKSEGLTDEMINAPSHYGLPVHAAPPAPAVPVNQPFAQYGTFPQPGAQPPAPPAPASPQQQPGQTGVMGAPGVHVPTNLGSEGSGEVGQ